MTNANLTQAFLKQQFDVIIIGAGIAGISAAVKAASLGAAVLLIEQYSFVGGMSTAGMVSPFMKHEVNGTPLVRGVFEAIEIEMRENKGMIDNGFFAHSFRFAAFNLLKRSGCHLLLNTVISGVEKTDKTISAVTVFTNGVSLRLKAKIFIDTSGDAQLLFLGNFPWEKGDEKSGLLQALTLFFRIGNINLWAVSEYVKNNREDFFSWMDFSFNAHKIISVAGFFSIVKKAIAEGRLSSDIQYIFFTTLPEQGEASFNTSNILVVDGSSSIDLTKAELIGRTQAQQIVRLLQKEIPGFEEAFLLETAAQVGVRETRRAIGDYIVTGDDIKTGKKFPDRIAQGCYGIDIHGQKKEASRMEHLPEGDFYEVPMRALFVTKSTNLLAAGRCISSTREGHSALRIQPTSAATGEACGAIAALAALSNKTIRDISYDVVRQTIFYNISGTPHAV